MSKIKINIKVPLIYFILLSIISLMASVSPTNGQITDIVTSKSSQTTLLTLQQAQNLALENNKLIKKGNQGAESSLNKKKAMFTNYLPKFELSANYLLRSESTQMTLEGGYLPTYNFNPNNNELEPNLYINPLTNQPVYDQDGNPIFNQYALFPDKDLEILPKAGFSSAISLKQPIFTGGKITSAYRIATLGEDASQLNLKLSQENVLFSTEKAYWKVLSLVQKKKLTEKYLVLVENILQKVQDSFDVGMINKNQLLQAKVKYNEVALLDQEAENGLDLATMALAQEIGLPLSSQLILTDSLNNLTSMINLNNFSIADYSNRYDYQILKIKQKVADLNINLERSAFLPQIGILASYNYLSYQLNEENHDDFSTNAMAQFSLPIFQWGESIYKVKEAKAKYKAETFNLENTSQQMALQIKQSISEVENKLAKVTLAQSSLDQAHEYLKLETDSYEVGMTTLTDLLNAQTQWQKAYSNFIDAQFELTIAYKQLEKNCGKYLTQIM